MFFNKKYFADDKKNYKLDRIFVSNQIFLINMLKLLKIPGFSRILKIFVQNYRFFQVFVFA